MLRRRMMLLAAKFRYVFLKVIGRLEMDVNAELRTTESATAESKSCADISLNAGLETSASAPVEADAHVGVRWECELYVHPNAPMATNDPLKLISKSQVIAPTTAVCESVEPATITPKAQANAPMTIHCEAEKVMQISADVQGGAAVAALLISERLITIITGSNEMTAVKTTHTEIAETLKLSCPGKLQVADAATLAVLLGLNMEIAAELWVKNELWIEPILKNNILGVTQARSAELVGNTLRIS